MVVNIFNQSVVMVPFVTIFDMIPSKMIFMVVILSSEQVIEEGKFGTSLSIQIKHKVK